VPRLFYEDEVLFGRRVLASGRGDVISLPSRSAGVQRVLMNPPRAATFVTSFNVKVAPARANTLSEWPISAFDPLE
jgi:hypothetical protein